MFYKLFCNIVLIGLLFFVVVISFVVIISVMVIILSDMICKEFLDLNLKLFILVVYWVLNDDI